MKKIAIFAVFALLTSCTTCHQHPAWCTAGVIILGTSAALSFKGTGHDPVVTRPPFCGPTGDACK